MKYREIIDLITKNGWYLYRTGKGSHLIYRHPTRPGSIVLSSGGKLNRDIPRGTEQAILRQAGLR